MQQMKKVGEVLQKFAPHVHMWGGGGDRCINSAYSNLNSMPNLNLKIMTYSYERDSAIVQYSVHWRVSPLEPKLA